MSKFIDLIGEEFGRLTVVERSYPNGKAGNAKWLCRCECGKLTIVIGHNLTKNGGTKSCGCLQREAAVTGNKKRSLSHGLGNMRKLIKGYKRGAKRRGHIYKLTEEQFKGITQKNCHYCNAKPNNIINAKDTNGAYTYNGIDRIDNSKGYIMGNIVPCCKQCNYAKNILTQKQFKDWITKIYSFQRGKA